MDPNNTSPANEVVVGDDVAVDLYPFIRTFKNGRIERFQRKTTVPACAVSSGGGVATRDVVVDRGTGVSARLFLPTGAAAAGRLPLVVYIRGGTFCTESAFSRMYHRYATSLAAAARALVVSVEYRLAPEHPIPAAYDDAWAALRWVASLSDPWLVDHADPNRLFLAGDSAGGNIAYHTAVRARDAMDVEGVVLVHPYLWGPERLPSETMPTGMFGPNIVDRVWPFVTAGKAGNDDPRINPPDDEIASLTCRRALVAVAGKDILRDRGLRLAACMRRSPWIGGDVTLVESEGEDHGFHLYNPRSVTSRKLMESIVHFVSNGNGSGTASTTSTTTTTTTTSPLQVRTRCALTIPPLRRQALAVRGNQANVGLRLARPHHSYVPRMRMNHLIN